MIQRLTYLFGCFVLLLIFWQCHSAIPTSDTEPTTYESQVRQTAVDYFQTFSERKDWNKLLSYYRADLQFHDIMLHLELDSLWQFERFYNWPDTGFQKLSPDQQHLAIESLVVEDSTAVVRGHLNPFYYYGKKMDSDWGMEFTIWLYFDEDLKIKRQVDWMEYDPSVMEGVLTRYKTQGVEKRPDWLDLTRD